MSSPRIFYFCYDHNNPTGGQKITYQHVDILNRNGFSAFALHSKPGFRLTWFENSTCTIDRTTFDQVFDTKRDYIVLPEDLGSRINLIPGKKVIFDKNLYYGFSVLEPKHGSSYPALAPNIIAIFTLSEHNRKHLQFAYPSVKIIKVDSDICTDTFQYRPLESKEALISCVPKARNHLYTLYHMLQSRGASGLNQTGHFKWIFLGKLTEKQVAETLSRSLIFISLSVDEGFHLMPVEAMACGCIVASYGCGPLLENLPRPYRFEHSNLISVAKFMERIMDSFPHDLGRYETMVESGRKIALSFSRRRQEVSVLKAWKRILARH
jgi:glycosyltransferase involved in cell wall biosynthesis